MRVCLFLTTCKRVAESILLPEQRSSFVSLQEDGELLLSHISPRMLAFLSRSILLHECKLEVVATYQGSSQHALATCRAMMHMGAFCNILSPDEGLYSPKILTLIEAGAMA